MVQLSEKARAQAGQPRVKVVLGNPSKNGSRHMSFGFRSLVWFLSGAAAVLLFVGFIAGDYLQLELIRARDFIAIKALEFDRSRIQDKLSKLQLKHRELQKTNIDLATSKAELESRMSEIAGVLSGLDVFDPVVKNSGKTRSRDGVGGAEVSCSADKKSCKSSKKKDEGVESPNVPKVSWEAKKAAIRYLPIGAPGQGRISSRYGVRISPFSGQRAFHEGIDLPLPHGSLVKTSGDGVVSEVKWHSTYGLMVEVEHSKGLISRYAHLSRSRVKRGDVVTRGQIIAYSGSSGRATGPHLHYEILTKGKAVDPMKFIALGQSLVRIARGDSKYSNS